MWHFGLDSSISYSKELFETTWRKCREVFNVYSKKRRKNNKNTIVVIRSDVQQYPNVCLREAIKSKLDLLNA